MRIKRRAPLAEFGYGTMGQDMHLRFRRRPTDREVLVLMTLLSRYVEAGQYPQDRITVNETEVAALMATPPKEGRRRRKYHRQGSVKSPEAKSHT